MELSLLEWRSSGVEWLKESVSFSSPLHHIEVLTPERTIALLRSGKHSPVAGPFSPADVARKHPGNEVAELVLRASEAWSPSNHALWGDKQRARAVELLKLGYSMSTHLPIEVWIGHIMPHAISWDD